MNTMQKFSVYALLALCSTPAWCNLSLGNTRLVVNEQDQSSPISVNNTGETPLLVQSWVSTEDKGAKTPFVVTPPLFRLEGKQENTLRVLHLPANLPTDRESLFWLNVKEIPPLDKAMEGKNVLRIAINNRIKLFYRPRGLTGSADQAPQALDWQLRRQASGKWQLWAHNPTPYHITFASVKFNGQPLQTHGMLKPLSDMSFELKKAPGASASVDYSAINDYGGDSKVISKTAQPAEVGEAQ